MLQAIAEPPQRPSLDELERDRILRTLEQCGGNQVEAAKLLGIGRSTLWRKLRQYGLT